MKVFIYITLIVCCLISYTLSNNILFILIPIIIILGKIIIVKVNRNKTSKIAAIISDSFIVLYFLIGLIFLQTFGYDTYCVTSNSMENTLYKGDYILINKMHYGAKVLKSSKKNGRRLPGFQRVKRNDIVVFESKNSNKNNIPLIKRCIGIPADTICIDSGNILINNKSIIISNNAKFKYNIFFNKKEDYKVLYDYDIFPKLSKTSYNEK